MAVRGLKVCILQAARWDSFYRPLLKVDLSNSRVSVAVDVESPKVGVLEDCS